MTRKETFKLLAELEMAYRNYKHYKNNNNELLEVVCKHHAEKMEELCRDIGISEENIKITKKHALTW